MKECKNKPLFSGKRSNNSKDIFAMLIKVFKDPQFCFNVKDQLEPKGWWCWPFLTLSDINQLQLCTLSAFAPTLCPSAHSSSQISIHHTLPFMNGHLLLAQNFLQFCCLGGHHFGKDLQCSPCLPSPNWSLAWLSFGLISSKKWTQISSQYPEL